MFRSMDHAERLYAVIRCAPRAITERELVEATGLHPLVVRAELASLSAGRTWTCRRVDGQVAVYDRGIHGRLPQPLARIVSGGQTGIDTAGLKAAKRVGLPTGGFAPRGWLREDPETGGNVSASWLATDFGLVEYEADGSPAARYRARTLANVENSDATLVLTTNTYSPGAMLTQRTAEGLGKPVFSVEWTSVVGDWGPAKHSADVATIADRIVASGARVLNVAGTRESGAPGIEGAAEEWLCALFALMGYAARDG